MKKNELIKELKKALKTEESIISVAGEHMQALVLRSSISREHIEEARILLQKVMDDSKRHRQIVEALIKHIEKEKKNDY